MEKSAALSEFQVLKTHGNREILQVGVPENPLRRMQSYTTLELS